MRSNSPSSHTGIGSSVVGCTAPGFFSSKSRAHCGNFLAICLPRSRASSTRIEMGGYYVWSYKMDRRAPRNRRSYPIRFVHRFVISGTIHSAERQNWRPPSPLNNAHKIVTPTSTHLLKLRHFRQSETFPTRASRTAHAWISPAGRSRSIPRVLGFPRASRSSEPGTMPASRTCKQLPQTDARIRRSSRSTSRWVADESR